MALSASSLIKPAGLIKEEADKAKISEKFEEIIVPTHDVTEVKRGKRIQRKKKYLPENVLNKKEMLAYQLSERGGKIHCIDKNDRVSIGGEAITFFRGEIDL